MEINWLFKCIGSLVFVYVEFEKFKSFVIFYNSLNSDSYDIIKLINGYLLLVMVCLIVYFVFFFCN